MAERFIKLYSKMLDWEWYDDINTCRLFIHCLLKANWQSTKWHGIEIKEGQFVTSLTTLAEETHLSVRQVRVALKHLKMTGEVTSKGQSKYSVITVNSWNEYQGSDKQGDKQVTSKRQASDKQVTTDIEDIEESEYKNINNNINNYIVGKSPEEDFQNSNHDAVVEIIDYLNSVLGTRYTAKSKSSVQKINARLAEGHTVDDFKTVIDKKNKQWADNPEMAPYLRPETLFAASHFESYLNEIETSAPKKKNKAGFDSQRKYDYDELLKELNDGT